MPLGFIKKEVNINTYIVKNIIVELIQIFLSRYNPTDKEIIQSIIVIIKDRYKPFPIGSPGGIDGYPSGAASIRPRDD
jgi:predicted nucleic-acid-binding protein|tara:strand:- start:37 stop:270 length:234 start_codon:yes stop_codon:yes gene_type:complete